MFDFLILKLDFACSKGVALIILLPDLTLLPCQPSHRAEIQPS
nr:MAG TPA: hypothetical protein [Caudoviricetes sp.]DAI49117.1 MAG TPA: hypothetical protein [Bacteriophage sp.]